MDEFERYLLELKDAPAILVEAVLAAYKICHQDEPDGKCGSGSLVSHHPCAANPLYTVPSACTEARGAASKLAENVRPSHEPLAETNLGVCMSHVDTSVFVESKDSNNKQVRQENKSQKQKVHIFSFEEILPKMQALLNKQSFFNRLMENRDLTLYRDVWLKSGVCSKKSTDSAYTYFRPAQDTSIYDVLRITDHRVILGNVRKGTAFEVSLQFENDNDPNGMHGKNEDEKILNDGKTKVIVWHFNHKKLRHNYQDVMHGHVSDVPRSYKETQVYKVFAEILHFFETGEFNVPFNVGNDNSGESDKNIQKSAGKSNGGMKPGESKQPNSVAKPDMKGDDANLSDNSNSDKQTIRR